MFSTDGSHMYLIFNSPDERDLFYKQIVQQPGKVLSHGEISLIVIKFIVRLCTDFFPTYTWKPVILVGLVIKHAVGSFSQNASKEIEFGTAMVWIQI